MPNTNEELIRQKYWQIWDQGQSDPEYARLYAEMGDLEPLYEAVMEGLPDDSQDIIRDYVNQCEEMSRRLLELACGELVSRD